MESRALGLSLLGYGCMRFPRKNGRIDKEATEQLILTAYERGITYYDTAYIYPGSEETLGAILKKHGIREKVQIASKFAHYMIRDVDTLEKLFQTSLERLQTTYLDNVLMHMLPDVTTWEKLKAMGVDKWIEEKKASGQIRRIGFSFHGNADAFIKLLDAYPWEFCQCQYNYMDENSQAGRRGVEHAYELGIPVIIMEPLRGGRLTNGLPEEAAELLKGTIPSWRFRRNAASPGETVEAAEGDAADPVSGDTVDPTAPAGAATLADNTRYDFRKTVRTGAARALKDKRRMEEARRAAQSTAGAATRGASSQGRRVRPVTPAEWGLSWLYDQKEIAVVLSGMNDMNMLKENIRIAECAHVGMFSEADHKVIDEVKAILDAKVKVKCTGCGYCMPCPFGVDIPGCFRCYNDQAVNGWARSFRDYLMTTTFRADKSYASLCHECGRCEKLCPQGIPIREKLKETARHMEHPIFKVTEFASRGMFKGKK